MFRVLYINYVYLGTIDCFECTREDRMGSYNQNGPKRRIWRRLGHQYVIFLMFRVLYTNYVYLGTIDCFECTREVGMGSYNEKGPNDARRVVWAISTRFFLCFVFYILTMYI